MAKFVLVQPALQDVGGHYYDFAARILPEVETLGYQAVLAVHRDCRHPDGFPATWELVPVFRRAESRMRPPRRRWSAGEINNTLLRGIAQWHDRIGDWLRARRWQARMAEFRESCRELFARVPLSAGDHVLFASAGDLDLAGFGQYLRRATLPAEVRWSFLFHYSLFEGREADYARQSARLEMLRGHYQHVFASLRGCDLKFYATTSRLAAQFDHLGIGQFESIRYPVNSAFRPDGTVREPGHNACSGGLDGSSPPVRSGAEHRNESLVPHVDPGGTTRRVICAGGIRREKGSHVITHLIGRLETFLARNAIQLLVQSEDTRKAARVLALTNRQPVERCASYAAVRAATAPVVLVPHPLEPYEYTDLVRSAHIGLFLYDDKAYYARASGILLELLSCGLPAIVPAGCWLSDLLFEPAQQYLEEVDRTVPAVRVFRWEAETRDAAPERLPHRVHRISREARAGEEDCRFTLDVPAGAGELLLSFRHGDTTGGTWTRVETLEHGATGTRRTTVVGGSGNQPIRVLQPAAAGRRVTVTLSDAYRDAPLPLRSLEIRCLTATDEFPQGRPRSAVGLTAAGVSQVPQLLEEMLTHYAHYRETAARYAQVLTDRHSPRHTARQFLRLPPADPLETGNGYSCTRALARAG